ncbi:MAG: tRNA (adenosine(37)-N6)-threonylcarbamoyltransferase complex dimerization subunit type 1 TsaB, partial [Eubacteriaceae bacterium]|nr:tRNA (adenosine(37)-N6)-threonylcarbamoyltransferase complex dimerization subunit type 1 TsaB [Eubacteriaceae bacterium]
MRVLALDTSTRAASCAIVENGRLLGEFYTDFKLKHSEKLLNILEHLLNDTRLTKREIYILALNAGPGSVTGLRIGSATAKAFAHALGLKIAPISCLEATAFQQTYFGGLICPIFDAQQGNVYAAAFDFRGTRMRRLYRDSAVSLREILMRLPNTEEILFCGDAVAKYKETVDEIIGERALYATPLTMLPHASSIALMAYEARDEMAFAEYG